MALRSLGQSLVAKASPGGKLRETQEARSMKPAIPEKGQPGNISRDTTEEIDVSQVPEGSAKILRVSPGVETTSLPGEPAIPPELLAGAMGTGAPVPGGVPQGADSQSLFRSPGAPATGVTPGLRSGGVAAAPVTQGGRQAKVSGTIAALPNTTKYNPQAVQDYVTSQQQAENTQRENPIQAFLNTTIGGGRASADPGNQNFQRLSPAVGQVGGTYQKGGTTYHTPTTGQYISGAVGKAASAIGNILRSGAISNVGNKLQSYGGALTPTVAKQGSVAAAANNLRSQVSNTVNNLRSQATNVLKKLFGR